MPSGFRFVLRKEGILRGSEPMRAPYGLEVRDQRIQVKRNAGEHQEAAEGYKDDEGDGTCRKQAQCFDQEAGDQERAGNLQAFIERICDWHQCGSLQNLAVFKFAMSWVTLWQPLDMQDRALDLIAVSVAGSAL